MAKPLGGIRGGGGGGALPYHFNIQTKQGPEISVSNIRDIAFYGCSEVIPNKNFKIFTAYATTFDQFMPTFHFFSNYIGAIDHFTLDCLKRSDT